MAVAMPPALLREMRRHPTYEELIGVIDSGLPPAPARPPGAAAHGQP